jgi:hypothetical protein
MTTGRIRADWVAAAVIGVSAAASGGTVSAQERRPLPTERTFVGVVGDLRFDAAETAGAKAERFVDTLAPSLPGWVLRTGGADGATLAALTEPDPRPPVNGETRDRLLSAEWMKVPAGKRWVVLHAGAADLRAGRSSRETFAAATKQAEFWKGLGYSVVRTTVVPAPAGSEAARLNEMIRAERGWTVCDLAAVPGAAGGDKSFWEDDGLRPRPEGRRALAGKLAETLKAAR